MKNVFTLALIFFGLSSIAQIDLNHEGTAIGATYSIDSTSGVGVYFQIDIYMINNSGATETPSFTRYRNYHTYGWTDQICDDLICFNADDVLSWDRPTSPALTVPAGDSSIMQLKVFPNEIPGCAIYTYYIENAAKVVTDSIQVTFTLDGGSCFLEVNAEEIEYTVYPNPADQQLNIQVTNATSTDQVKIFNILGEEVRNTNLINGINTIDVSDLNNGVYFYSVLRNNDIIETKKIFIRH